MNIHRRSRVAPGIIGGAIALTMVLAGAMSTSVARAEESFKIGVVTFLSGPAAESFGAPAWDGGKLLVDGLNRGQIPAPYDTVGFGGMKIEPVVVDESGGATKQVQEYRNLVQREKVDAVVGYVSSGDCLAVSPVAEEMKALLVLYDCGTPRVFEERGYSYVFRTAAHATMDNVSLARYLAKRKIKINTYAGINPDYAWGRDSWADFTRSMQRLMPQAKLVSELFPKFGAGQYGTEISALMREKPDLVYSSLWGGDLQAMTLQGSPRGLYKRSQVVLSAADHVLPSLGQKMPDGTILGARGQNGLFAPESPINDWFFSEYSKAYGVYPVQAPYRMVQAILGLKLAVEKAMAANGGNKPTAEQIAAALRGSEWQGPAGRVKMALADGHQAIQDNAIGRTRWDSAKGLVVLEDIERFAAECVNPPAGTTSAEWIDAGFPGAKCE